MTTPIGLPASADYGDCTPAQTAHVLLAWCRAKAAHDTVALAVLGVMAGVFIALGAVLFTTVMMGVPPGLGAVRLIAGVAFAMGLLLVCMTGAELSTGNCMLVAAWSRGDMSAVCLWRILAVSFAANAVGAFGIAVLMHGTGLLDGRHGRLLVSIAETKMALGPMQAFTRAVLCNAQVCLAVWLILSARTIPSKFLGLSLPIAGFVACGFEHSIANLYFLPAGLLAGATGNVGAAEVNIVVVTLGNLVGGAGVALALRVAHLRKRELAPEQMVQSARA